MLGRIVSALQALARTNPRGDNDVATQVEGAVGRLELDGAMSRLLSILHTANVAALPPTVVVGDVARTLRKAGFGVRDWSEDQGLVHVTLPGQRSELLIRLELARPG